MKSALPRIATIIALALALCPAAARADIDGFRDFSDFAVNIGDAGSSPTASFGTIHLITGGGQDRSVFDKFLQPITHFTASFTWQNQTNLHDFGGAAFILENVTAGPAALGFGTTNFGYSGNAGPNSFASTNGKSVAITLETPNTPTTSGLYSNGVIGGGSSSTATVDLASGHPINVTIDYSGTTVDETLFDTVTLQSIHIPFFANLVSILGSSTAYVGFTAASNSGNASQTFSNFQFITPEPATLPLLALAGLMLLCRQPRRTFSSQ